MPLAERTRRANEAAAKHGKSKTILVSIHVNASNGKGTGWEIHTYPGKTKADDLAQIFWDTANEMFGKDWKIRGDWSDGDGDWESNFYILRKPLARLYLQKTSSWITKGIASFFFPRRARRLL